MYSVAIQFPEIATALLNADPELVKGQDRFGKAPLHCAVEVGNAEMVQLLVSYDADVNVRCHDGMTPLMMCCTGNSDDKKNDVMNVLLQCGALVELKDYRGGRTALHVAAVSGNVQAIELLIAAGADINEIDKTLRSPLTLAISSGVRGPIVNENHMKIISLLVSAGAQLNVRLNESCNPLMSAALLKSETMVRYFLALGADPNITFSSGVTPSLIAASTGDLSTLKTLIYYNCKLTNKGKVYKRRRRIEYTVDSFELAYIEGYLELCVLMAEAGYRVHNKLSLFITDSKSDLVSFSPLAAATAFYQLNEAPLTLIYAQNLPENYIDHLQWLIDRASYPRSLREEAVFAVRSSLGDRLVNGVDKLPLPQSVKNSIMLSHLWT